MDKKEFEEYVAPIIAGLSPNRREMVESYFRHADTWPRTEEQKQRAKLRYLRGASRSRICTLHKDYEED